jgi:hypothetical protein
MKAGVENVQGAVIHAADHAAPVTAIVKPLTKVDRVAVNRSTSFRRHYPVGGPQAHIWNRALSRSDEVRRVPGVDPRSVGPHGVDPRVESHINHPQRPSYA